jgi:LemA protein
MNAALDSLAGAGLDTWGSWLLQALLILTLLFWMVGAFNRLMRLRQSVSQAWAQVDDGLPRRAVALETLLSAVRETLAEGESASLSTLALALERERQAAVAVRQRPFDATPVLAWVQTERDLASPMARLHALIEQHQELNSRDSVRSAGELLADLAQRLSYARQAYNEAAATYNAALLEYPTRLLVPLFRLRPCARL